MRQCRATGVRQCVEPGLRMHHQQQQRPSLPISFRCRAAAPYHSIWCQWPLDGNTDADTHPQLNQNRATPCHAVPCPWYRQENVDAIATSTDGRSRNLHWEMTACPPRLSITAAEFCHEVSLPAQSPVPRFFYGFMDTYPHSSGSTVCAALPACCCCCCRKSHLHSSLHRLARIQGASMGRVVPAAEAYSFIRVHCRPCLVHRHGTAIVTVTEYYS